MLGVLYDRYNPDRPTSTIDDLLNMAFTQPDAAAYNALQERLEKVYQIAKHHIWQFEKSLPDPMDASIEVSPFTPFGEDYILKLRYID